MCLSIWNQDVLRIVRIFSSLVIFWFVYENALLGDKHTVCSFLLRKHLFWFISFFLHSIILFCSFMHFKTFLIHWCALLSQLSVLPMPKSIYISSQSLHPFIFKTKSNTTSPPFFPLFYFLLRLHLRTHLAWNFLQGHFHFWNTTSLHQKVYCSLTYPRNSCH